MTLNKQEFKALVMLYAANIDGNIQSEEVKLMLQKTDFDTIEKVEKIFDKMSDMEVLECIRENKTNYIITDDDRNELLADVHAIIQADEKSTMMEEQMVKAIQRMLD